MAAQPSRDGRPDTLAPAVEQAIAGKTKALFDLLMRGSGLPGTRVNLGLAEAFGATLAGFDAARSLKFVEALRATSADEHLGGSPYEFLPVCAVIGLGAIGSRNEKLRPAVIEKLHDAADDMRFRVRDAVPIALCAIGKHSKDELLPMLENWPPFFNQAASLLRVLGTPAYLDSLQDADTVVRYVDQAFRLLWNAPRSAERYPGYKSLLEALHIVPARVATRFGPTFFPVALPWTKVKEPMLRDIIAKFLDDEKLKTRHPLELREIGAALGATAPPRRDPRTDFGPTRGRGRKTK
jgi:hypothetical protein